MPKKHLTYALPGAGIFDQAAIAMAFVSLDGCWLQVNPALCTLLGYDEAELLGHSLLTMTHPADRELTAAALKQMPAQPRMSDALEKRYLRKDGTVVWVLV